MSLEEIYQTSLSHKILYTTFFTSKSFYLPYAEKKVKKPKTKTKRAAKIQNVQNTECTVSMVSMSRTIKYYKYKCGMKGAEVSRGTCSVVLPNICKQMLMCGIGIVLL